ncbi:sialidase family protein [Mannheimia granulomatis]|uniref:sialidase family protein n=1 Tax=Mannheimia granulomatis TaxID=85402 RepID=UPI000A017497|nr:sialidase family protein [Mannheimia granulomatis]
MKFVIPFCLFSLLLPYSLAKPLAGAVNGKSDFELEIANNIIVEYETPLFSANKSAKNYRIPSLLTTEDGVVIAAIDKHEFDNKDWGNIDLVIRRSLDNGKTWQNDQVVIDLVEQPYNAPYFENTQSAFVIDPLMVQDKESERIFLLIDMYPESSGIHSHISYQGKREPASPANVLGSGYTHIDEQPYLRLKAKDQTYTLRDPQGNFSTIYDSENKPTNYKVVTKGNSSKAYRDLGDVYLGDINEANYQGNIFLSSQKEFNRSAPFSVEKTSYLWLIYSDDNGKTWSNPRDLNPQLKKDWMKFLGTGPGTGVQLENGTLLMPVYFIDKNDNEATAVIKSSDGGETWVMGESPLYSHSKESGKALYKASESHIVELNNGVIKMFTRTNKGKVLVSTSNTEGMTWQSSELDDELLNSYTQLSAIKYSKKINGKEYILLSNAHSKQMWKRINGRVWIGEIKPDNSIDWQDYIQITAGNETFGYSSLAELPDGKVGLLYEKVGGEIRYVRLEVEQILKDDKLERHKRSFF